MELQIPKILDILKELEDITPDKTLNMDNLIEVGTRLAGYLSFSGQQMATARRIVNQNKVRYYNSLVFSKLAQGMIVTPMMAKDYVAGKLSDDQYNYELCERCNRAIVHTLDFLRSALSTLKEEMKIAQYQNFQT